MDRIKPPSELVFDCDMATAWKKWKEHFTFYMTATESDEKEDNVKTCILLSCIGPKGREVYGTFDYAEEGDNKKLDVVMDSRRTANLRKTLQSRDINSLHTSKRMAKVSPIL